MSGFRVVDVVVVVVVVVVVDGTGVAAVDGVRRELPRTEPALELPDLLPPPPNCCVIVGNSLTLIGRPSSVDNSFRSLLIVCMSCWPRAISALDSLGLSGSSARWRMSFGRAASVEVVEAVVVRDLPVRFSAIWIMLSGIVGGWCVVGAPPAAMRRYGFKYVCKSFHMCILLIHFVCCLPARREKPCRLHPKTL